MKEGNGREEEEMLAMAAPMRSADWVISQRPWPNPVTLHHYSIRRAHSACSGMATSLRSLLLGRSWRCTNAKQWVSLKSSPVHRRLQSTSSASSKQYNAKRDAFLTPTMVLLGLMPIVTFSLGTWQVERLKWKVNLIDELEQKLQREPMSLPGQVKYAHRPRPLFSTTHVS